MRRSVIRFAAAPTRTGGEAAPPPAARKSGFLKIGGYTATALSVVGAWLVSASAFGAQSSGYDAAALLPDTLFLAPVAVGVFAAVMMWHGARLVTQGLRLARLGDGELSAPPGMDAAAAGGAACPLGRLISEPEPAPAPPADRMLDIRSLPADWLAQARAANESRTEAAIRRAADIVLATALLLFTLPLIAATALAVRLDSRGSILYRQVRIGRGRTQFAMLKFRSMVQNAEAASGPAWAMVGDPRVTRVGRLIRLTRIDELPQLINILRGDMSLVGPRPERPHFVAMIEQEVPHYGDRHLVRPGLTGWAQVNAAYGASVEEAKLKLAYDLYYLQRRSLALDLQILLRTVRVILRQEGAR